MLSIRILLASVKRLQAVSNCMDAAGEASGYSYGYGCGYGLGRAARNNEDRPDSDAQTSPPRAGKEE